MKDAGMQIGLDDGRKDLCGVDESGERGGEQSHRFLVEFVAS
jgi:hypothetical protein